jgi:hypothetical protein
LHWHELAVKLELSSPGFAKGAALRGAGVLSARWSPRKTLQKSRFRRFVFRENLLPVKAQRASFPILLPLWFCDRDIISSRRQLKEALE